MELYARKKGNASRHLIVLHGLYGSGDNWLSIASALSSEYTVHLPDQRNHGKSAHHYDHSYRAMTDDLLEYANKEHIESFSLAGHSMGGKTAMFFASRFPERLEKLIVLDISPRSYHQLSDVSEHSLFHLNLMSFLINSGIEQATNLLEAEAILSRGIESRRLVQFMLKNVEKQHGKLQWRINLEALMNNLPEIGSGLNPDDFIDHKINVPTLFLRGTKSDYLPHSDEKLIRFIFGNVSVRDIAEAGHWMHAEQPELVVKEMLEFLK